MLPTFGSWSQNVLTLINKHKLKPSSQKGRRCQYQPGFNSQANATLKQWPLSASHLEGIYYVLLYHTAH